MSEAIRLPDPDQADLTRIYDAKYYRFGEPGWGPRMRKRFGYYTPDDHYEAMVAKLVTAGSDWADIGCGRNVFPAHPDLARELAGRSGFFYGIDPDPNVLENEFVNDRFHGLVEDCDTTRQFDVITMRMVAEHITDPERALGRISTLLKPGGRLVIYTPSKWAPMSVVATIIPFKLHHPLKQLIWDAQARDTFPTAYKLNTRADLLRHTGNSGLQERYFRFLDDCRVLSRYRFLNWMELQLRRVLNAVGLHYPETCILAVYQKPVDRS
jgi:SAM-dependent methyltransferase